MTAAGLSFAGFFHPLGQHVLRISGSPAVRQQGIQGGLAEVTDPVCEC
jgi:hypothetical protein